LYLGQKGRKVVGAGKPCLAADLQGLLQDFSGLPSITMLSQKSTQGPGYAEYTLGIADIMGQVQGLGPMLQGLLRFFRLHEDMAHVVQGWDHPGLVADVPSDGEAVVQVLQGGARSLPRRNPMRIDGEAVVQVLQGGVVLT